MGIFDTKPKNQKLQDPNLNKTLGSSKKSSSKKQTEKKEGPPKYVQDTIPYANAYTDGIFVDKKGVYSRTYPLLDVNFEIESIQTQSDIYMAYQDLFNLFSPDVVMQINLINQNLQKDKFHEMILLKLANDGKDDLREEMNEMLISKEDVGENKIVQKKYLTIGTKADSIDAARTKLNLLDKNIRAAIKRINKDDPEYLSTMERLELLYNFYNAGKEQDFLLSYMPADGDVNSFDITQLSSMGLTTKDIIAPDYFEFARDKMLIGDQFAQALYVKDYPTILASDFLTSLNSVACTMATSVYFEIVDKQLALKKTMNLQTNTNAEIISAQKKAMKNGYDPELLPQRLKNNRDAVEDLREQIQNNNQKLIKTTIVIVHTAPTLEQLENQMEQILSIGRSKMFTIAPLKEQQEMALNSVLPFARNEIKVYKSLISESAAMLIPFKLQEVLQKNGIYYGLNTISQRMIVFNRKDKSNMNYNGLILGTSGSGKSFLAKKEIVYSYLRTNDDILILDPEGEYSDVVRSLGGTVLNYTAGCGTHINPFDMNLAVKEDNIDPLVEKINYVSSICEVAAGNKRGLTQAQRSMVGRCIVHVYEKYLQTQDPADMPTMTDFYNDLKAQRDPDAESIAKPLEQFTSYGALDLFAYQTNVELDNRLTAYNTKNLTNPSLKDVALIACLNDIWNRTIDNRQKGKFTWIYIDEFHLFLRSDNIADFMTNIWKRARKWGGVPTGITQDISDLLKSQASEVIFSNSNCIMMLNQAAGDRASLSRMLNISERCQQFITNASAGSGLMYTGQSMIPFTDKFPEDTKLYTILSSSPTDDISKLPDMNFYEEQQNQDAQLPDFVQLARKTREEQEKLREQEQHIVESEPESQAETDVDFVPSQTEEIGEEIGLDQEKSNSLAQLMQGEAELSDIDSAQSDIPEETQPEDKKSEEEDKKEETEEDALSKWLADPENRKMLELFASGQGHFPENDAKGDK